MSGMSIHGINCYKKTFTTWKTLKIAVVTIAQSGIAILSANARETKNGKYKIEGNRLGVQMFHGGGAENNEDPHPEGPALERDRLVYHFFAFFLCLFSGRFVLE